MIEIDFSKKKKGNIIFNLPDSMKKMTARKKEDIADDDERLLKEIDIITSCGDKIIPPLRKLEGKAAAKMKKTAARMPTIDEAMSFILGPPLATPVALSKRPKAPPFDNVAMQ